MNSVQLMGRLITDPKAGKNVAMFTIAIGRPTKEKATDFPQIKVFGRQGENCIKYLHKGSQVAVEGSIETGQYQKNGETVYYTDVIAHRVEFIGSNTKHAENGEKAPVKAEEQPTEEQVEDFEALDEDVPF